VVVIRNVVSTTAGMKRKDHPNSTMMGNSTKSNYTISTELGEAMDAVNSDFETSEIDGEVVDMIIKYKLLHPPASCKAKWWKHFMKFGLTHFDKKDHAACKICFSQKNYSTGTVSTKGGGKGGLVRHLRFLMENREKGISKQPFVLPPVGQLLLTLNQNPSKSVSRIPRNCFQ